MEVCDGVLGLVNHYMSQQTLGDEEGDIVMVDLSVSMSVFCLQ